MELATGTTLHGFTIERREDLPEIEGLAYIGRHEQSGAKLLYLANDDDNKSFAIGFRTPPQDDTGVFHILEHSVLCGSRRFPVKEPFVDLLKGSMQTFLNAMTFADKTLYPVASTNERDLFNLMDVYLDAVFHPQIYSKQAIFEQEGWHYELVANDGEGDPAALGADETSLVYNGVVFNEMKGALSDASSVLYDEVQKALFPGTCYAFESGGTPEAIPTLTYENFLDEHRRHYRTDNSYIILYGDLDIDRALAFLDERYLAPVAAEQRELDEERAAAGLEPLRPREITAAHESIPGDVMVTMPQLCERCGGSADDVVTVRVAADSDVAAMHPEATPCAPYVRRTMDTALENACAGVGYVVGDASDRMRATAVEILLDALFGSNEAPLKRALLDAGIAHNVSAFLSDAVLQPFAVVQAQMPSEGVGENLHAIIAEKAREMLDAGLDKELVEAALSNAEFHMREHDTGTADGVIYAMASLSSWLYDDDAVTDYLRYEKMFASLRAELEGDYFERLCRELLCDNAHVAAVEIAPTPGEPDNDAAEHLAELNRTMPREERERIVAKVALLRELQEAPDSPEAVATLPRLSVDDIEDKPGEPSYALDDEAPVRCVRHSVATRGIAYAYRFFDTSCLSFDELPYLGVLARVLGRLDTAHHTAAEIDTLSQGKLGNLSFFVDVYERVDDPASIVPEFVTSASALSKNHDWLASLPREVLLETDFSDTGRILHILKQRKIAIEQGFANSGHTCAIARARSYFTKAGIVREQLGNVGFYRFLCELIDQFDERAADLSERLADISKRLFCDDNCTISFAGSDEDYAAFWQAHPECGREQQGGAQLVAPEPVALNEAFIVPTDVCFASVAWDWRLLDTPFDGSWIVAGRALSLDYLWNEVRVKGGAYGVGFQAQGLGVMRFYTYRDPHLDESLERIRKSSDWLAGFDPSDEEMDGFVVATVAALDAPIKPRTLIRRQMSDYFRGRTPEDRLAIRSQAIATDVAQVRAFSSIVAETVNANAVCAFGNRDILEASKAGLEVIPLVG